jgi:hypothetical protein
VEKNHEEYVNRHRAACSGAVDKLARAAEPVLSAQDALPAAS